jgi:hypothetical protein
MREAHNVLLQLPNQVFWLRLFIHDVRFLDQVANNSPDPIQDSAVCSLKN